MPVIDADAHVVETERTWEFMDPADAALRPTVLASVEPQADVRLRDFWRVGRRFVPRRAFDIAKTGSTLESQELHNIEARLRHMDELGVDVHVLYPTFFLTPVTAEPELEAALFKGYNRWMADVCAKGRGRLRWVAMAPTMTMDLALKEIAWAKDQGACGIYMRGLETGKILSDAHFHPLYAEASRLDMPICIHSASGSFAVEDICAPDSATFLRFKLLVVGSIHEIVMSRLPEKFPKLRFGVIECSASWVPYICHDLAARLERIYGSKVVMTDILKDNHIWVACQTDDDLPYVLRYTGEDNIMIGSDYGHNDTSSELLALRKLRESGTLPTRVIDKMLDDNPTRFYALA
jgi:predicted TIM-barrel fold metal-dependent hydrolase